jgi:hypothetical protein
MLYFVIDPKTEEELGEIECADDELLDTLEDNAYIEAADECKLVPRPDGEWHVSDGRNVILWLSNRGPDGEDDDDDDDDDFEEENDNDFENEDD